MTKIDINDPCNVSLYFKRPKGSKTIDIELLILDHMPSTEKIEKAKSYMEKARKDEYPKREPVKIQKLSNGKYRVLDGNTTTTILKNWGCTHVIAMEKQEK
ncbi:MAG: hypothetical protein ACTSWY_10545 [Promethearchaeota archaeon]